MASVYLLKDFVLNNQLHSFKISGATSKTTIKFGLHDALYHQHCINALWHMLDSNQKQPIAKTFLGRIISISFNKD